MKFSERIGKSPIRVDIQIDSIDGKLQNGLWNVICLFITNPIKENNWLKHSHYKSLIESIWLHLFKEPIDKIPNSTDGVVDNLRKRFFGWDYLQIYDFIDFVSSSTKIPFDINEYIEACNFILKRECSAYRFVNGNLSPITNESEIGEIEKAIYESKENSFKGTSIHLEEALKKLADRENPDYRNSIKESISAVESICQQISEQKNTELGKTLKKLKEKITIHGALEQGFLKLYGWTSDSDGIRHALMDNPNLDQEDAQYMLISCSAFINYLISKSNKTQ